MSTHPLDRSAREIARAIATGEIDARGVVAEALARAERVQPALNPFCFILHDQAMQAAAAADAARARGAALGQLHGVPFAAKDMTPTRGQPTTLGSWSSSDTQAAESALVVRRLEAAGAILIGKTTTPEFAHASFTRSPRWGVTRNPHDPTRTSGGSSGGSAVAVACGVVPFAEGTDMGGSVRIPASFCGVVGFKPSLGRIPMTILPSVFDGISHFGPIARRVDDAVAFMAATAGVSDEDIQSLPLAFSTERARAPMLAGRRFALSMDLGYYRVAPETAHAMNVAVTRLRDAGATVDEVPLGWTRDVNDRWFDIWCVFMAGYFGDRLAEFSDRMDRAVVAMIEAGRALDAVSIKRSEFLRTAMWRDLARLFASYDALLCPTCAMPAPSADDTDDDHVASLPDGRYGGLDMTCPFNLVPQCPALSVPIGTTLAGLPVGLQIVGPPHADEHVLGLGAAVEALYPGTRLPA